MFSIDSNKRYKHDYPTSISISKDSSLIGVSITRRGSPSQEFIDILQVDTGKVLLEIANSGKLVFSPDNSRVLVWRTNSLQIINMKDGALITKANWEVDDPITRLMVSPDEQNLWINRYNNPTIEILDADTGELISNYRPINGQLLGFSRNTEEVFVLSEQPGGNV